MSTEPEEKKVTIECSKNGPLIVKNLESFSNSKGESLPAKSVLALCRCGASTNKPYCDGNHTKIGFSDEKRTDGALNKRVTYVGKAITLYDNRGICSHASFCADDLEAVFNADREPWVNPESAPVQTIINIIKRCPSGALSYSIDNKEYRDQTRPPAITISKDGPYLFVGNIELKDVTWGEDASKEHYALCRCGGSKNLPFCDGTHRGTFQDKNT